jgi:hypothetical protein
MPTQEEKWLAQFDVGPAEVRRRVETGGYWREREYKTALRWLREHERAAMSREGWAIVISLIALERM